MIMFDNTIQKSLHLLKYVRGLGAHLTRPEFRARNMRYNFHVNKRLILVIEFHVQDARLEAEEVSNIHLHKKIKHYNLINMELSLVRLLS